VGCRSTRAAHNARTALVSPAPRAAQNAAVPPPFGARPEPGGRAQSTACRRLAPEVTRGGLHGPERDGRLRTLGDGLDSFERAEHVALVASLPEEPAERAPNLGEEVVAEVE